MSTAQRAMESPIRIACLQMEPRIGDKSGNVARSLGMIGEAAEAGANLVVLPELCNTGYMFATRDEAFGLAEPIPEGETVRAWSDAAARHKLHIIAGMAERNDDALYNSAVILGAAGLVGIYRKNHLWGAENLYFEPGNLGIPVFRTPIGRIAVAICYDIWFPEVFRLAALQGADLLCVPTNWVPMPEQPKDLPAMANILTMGGAHANALFVAAADRVGEERGQQFVGRSLIVNHTGWPAAGPASADRQEIIIAEVNLSDARRKRQWTEFNQVLRDRRTDLYAEMLGAQLDRGWY